jgi:farnesyl diphosphate synthase
MDRLDSMAPNSRVTRPAFDLRAWSAAHLTSVEQALSRWVAADATLAASEGAPVALVEAMRYAVLDGGKRLRPLLVMAAFEAVTGDDHPKQSSLRAQTHEAALRAQTHEAALRAQTHEAALRAACAVELIHAYSLVHDDMPCMDNDVLRRGKPTVHVKFGEAQALLAGDALQALAFDLLTPGDGSVPPAVQATLCRLLARASGHAGMAGGQAIDLASVGEVLNEARLKTMHRLKTGALLQASVDMGAACGAAPSAACGAARGPAGGVVPTPAAGKSAPLAVGALKEYGAAMGLAFQVVDDILDVTADSATLGKTAGKDAAHDKPTYVSLLGLQRSRDYAQELLAQAREALDGSGLADTRALRALADMVVNRSN